MRPRTVDFPVVTPEIQTGDATKLYTATLNQLQKSLWNDTRNAKTLAWMVTGLIQTGSSNPPDWIPSVQTQATRAQSTEHRFLTINLHLMAWSLQSLADEQAHHRATRVHIVDHASLARMGRIRVQTRFGHEPDF